MSFLLDQQLCFSLYSTSRLMIRSYDSFLKSLGITYPQFLVMICLWDHGTSTVDDLGEKLYLDSGTLSPLLKRLAEKGLLERRRDAKDERRVLISLTEAGQKMKDQAPQIIEKICELITLTQTEIGSMVSLLTKCRSQLMNKES